ncbi:hypothetical protein RUM43_004164 [Polyplax serrata]|uniref:Uncharacterized protein n=1 Tax=Polyplax serrata TaxID=468196 RepID=A0AAN8SAM7_POLSC
MDGTCVIAQIEDAGPPTRNYLKNQPSSQIPGVCNSINVGLHSAASLRNACGGLLNGTKAPGWTESHYVNPIQPFPKGAEADHAYGHFGGIQRKGLLRLDSSDST